MDNQFDQLEDRLINFRRHLHQHPELSGEERESSLLVYAKLGDEGFSVKLGHEGLGVIADYATDHASEKLPIFAMRADLDALPIQDEKTVAYRSSHMGIMHACGHDVHTAIVSGAILVLKSLEQQGKLPWPIRIRAIFQPAEETCEGASRMIESGALEGVAAIMATHVDPSLPVGRAGVRNGVLTASCDEVLIQIRGHGGHAARPHESKDPISAAAQLINALYLHLPRVTDSQDAVVATFGQISGGRNSNVIPEKVELKGTIRTLNLRVREEAKQHMMRIAQGVAETTETLIKVDFGVSSPSVVNDATIISQTRCALVELLGESAIHEIARPSMGSEDFAFYLERVPGALVRLGSAGPSVEPTALHTPNFDVDEGVIRVGVRLLVHQAIEWFRPKTSKVQSS
ncbi:MAG: amidohydrolase [Pirellulaceae bacterium]|nr:amidohydrolase [Pirellulaceae bacterium]